MTVLECAECNKGADLSNQPLSEQYYHAAKKWAEAHAKASMLEESKTAVLSQLMNKCGDVPVSHAEKEVKASEEWSKYLADMVKAREQANLAKVEMAYIDMKFHEQQSYEATERTKARL